MRAIRAAITISNNTVEEIKSNSILLFKETINKNKLDISNIVSIIFSCTDDITKAYPGKFIREYFSLDDVGIMHFNEMKVENSLKLCIRILLLADLPINTNVQHIYLKGAKNLRKDLIYNKL